MPKGVEKDQLQNSASALNLSNQLDANAANIYGALEPTLQAEAAHPSGYTPTQKSAMNTAAQQSAGGSQAATVGEGGLYSARTKNAGAAQAAIGAGSRGAGANLSHEALGTEMADANLANKKQQSGISGLGGLYGTDLSGGENALGLSNQALSGAAQSSNSNIWKNLANDMFYETTIGGPQQAAESAPKCFITTACVRAKGLPDDCHELTMLRWFRDNIMKATESGKEAVQEYYEVAPALVQKMLSLPNAQEIFSTLYNKLVKPCVEMIEAGRYDEATETYTGMVNELRREYGA